MSGDLLEKAARHQGHPLARYRPRPGDLAQEPGFLLRGILCDKLSFIGAYAGAGKTTAMAPLALIVAGVLEIPGIHIYGWRKVVYVSEHPEQVEMILAALIQHYNLNADLAWGRVLIVQAERMPVSSVVSAADEYQKLTVINTVGGCGVAFKPWVIVDTQSSLLHIENENDNAEMGGLVSALKAMDFPISVVAHTAKTHKHGQADTMTIRGGGALEADAHQVLYLSKDPDGEQRFIEIGTPKHRFVADWDALALNYHTAEQKALDPFGRETTILVGFSTVEPIAKQERIERQQESKEERRREAVKDAREAVLEWVNECEKRAKTAPEIAEHYPSKNRIETELDHPRKAIRTAIEELVTEGRIEHRARPHIKGHSGPKDYLGPVEHRRSQAAKLPDMAATSTNQELQQ